MDQLVENAEPIEPIEMSFDRATVELDALQRAVYALADLFSADVTVQGTQLVCVLHPRRASPSMTELRHRMRTEVNDQVLRLRIARQTEPIRNLIFAVAFSRTGLSEHDDTGHPEALDSY